MRKERQVGSPVAGWIALLCSSGKHIYFILFFFFCSLLRFFCSIAFSVGPYLQRRLGHVDLVVIERMKFSLFRVAEIANMRLIYPDSSSSISSLKGSIAGQIFPDKVSIPASNMTGEEALP